MKVICLGCHCSLSTHIKFLSVVELLIILYKCFKLFYQIFTTVTILFEYVTSVTCKRRRMPFIFQMFICNKHLEGSNHIVHTLSLFKIYLRSNQHHQLRMAPKSYGYHYRICDPYNPSHQGVI